MNQDKYVWILEQR